MSLRSRIGSQQFGSWRVIPWPDRCDQACGASVLVILMSTAACMQPGIQVDRGGQFSSTDPLAKVDLGQHPQLSSPSSAFRRACLMEQKNFCNSFPWSKENYNELAKVVDQRRELCRYFYVPEGKSADLRNQSAGDGALLTTVFAGGVLLAQKPETEGSHDWVEVRYRDNLGNVYGREGADGSGAFVKRSDVTCVIPSERAVSAFRSQTQGAESGRSQRSASLSGREEPFEREAIPDTFTTEVTPSPPSTLLCTINAPLLWKFNPFGSDIPCKRESGQDLKLRSGTQVTIKGTPERGAPTRYFEVNFQCTLTDNVIQHNTCTPQQ